MQLYSGIFLQISTVADNPTSLRKVFIGYLCTQPYKGPWVCQIADPSRTDQKQLRIIHV